MDKISDAGRWLAARITNLGWFITSWLPPARHRHFLRPVHSYPITSGNPTIGAAFTGTKPAEFTVVVFQCACMNGPSSLVTKAYPGRMNLGDFTPLATIPPLPADVPT
jgi:hypothetical protein